MSVDILKLKALATKAKRDQYDYVALNDYGMAVPPATVLELIAEIERRRQVNAEGCKPDSSILLSSASDSNVAPFPSLDKEEGCKPDLNTQSAKLGGTPIATQLAARDVLAERARQIEAESYTPERDDQYTSGQLADAASTYAWWARSWNLPYAECTHAPTMWPWAPETWKPQPQRQMLIKAGALILAEIERLDRQKAREVSP
ncbi:hypothetical protein WLF18_05055 [Pseudomonas shirazensis]|uniref:Phage protein n=1 Tax=Pseudomonas shirazensis TaxID=2745494 RepID=A0ABU8ZXC1_9PSED